MKKIYQNTLLIDDDKFTNFYNTKILANHDAFGNVSSVTSGKAALIYLNSVLKKETNKPDIIFLDINMPSMNGWEFLSEYSKLDKNLVNSIQLIILTSYTENDDYKKMEAIHDIIKKPLSKNDLDTISNNFSLKV